MNETYDVIICGTGLKECILSGLLSQKKLKVFHVDNNDYYGGDCASLNISKLWQKFNPSHPEPPTNLGHNRDWNADLIPKFVMANGNLVKILIYTKVSRYLEWKPVKGSYVYQFKKGGFFSDDKILVAKVPATDSEALHSDLMGLLEKNRMRKFINFVNKYRLDDPKTQKKFDIKTQSAKAMMEKFSLDANTIDFIGHAIALYNTDEYLLKPSMEFVERLRLYLDSSGRYGDSPFLYPIYGLGGIPEGFSRMSALHGGTYMLRANVEEILYDKDGKACGIRCGSEKAMAKMVICDPSYVKTPEKLKKCGQIIRCISILDHPIPSTNGAESVQIIIPQKQINRKNDIYIAAVSSAHAVCPKGLWITIISTVIETKTPEAEIEVALKMIGKVMHQFTWVSDSYEPMGDGKSDNVSV
jgi:Rab GDP dissociation inhibitor